MNYYVFLTERNAGSPIKFIKPIIDGNDMNNIIKPDENIYYENMKNFWLRSKDYFVKLINKPNSKNTEYYKRQAAEFLNIACHNDVLAAAEKGFWYPTEEIEEAINNSNGHFTEIPEYKMLKCIKDEAVIYRVFERAIEYAKVLLDARREVIDQTRKYSDSMRRSKTDYANLEYTD